MPKINKTITELRNTLKDAELTPEVGRTLPKSTARRFLHVLKQAEDPRELSRITYPLEEILLLCFLAILGGANTWVDIADGKGKIRWLRKFSRFRPGTPSHDELRYVFAKIDHTQFQTVIIGFLLDNISHIKKCLGISDTEGLPSSGNRRQGGKRDRKILLGQAEGEGP